MLVTKVDKKTKLHAIYQHSMHTFVSLWKPSLLASKTLEAASIFLEKSFLSGLLYILTNQGTVRLNPILEAEASIAEGRYKTG